MDIFILLISVVVIIVGLGVWVFGKTKKLGRYTKVGIKIIIITVGVNLLIYLISLISYYFNN